MLFWGLLIAIFIKEKLSWFLFLLSQSFIFGTGLQHPKECWENLLGADWFSKCFLSSLVEIPGFIFFYFKKEGEKQAQWDAYRFSGHSVVA